MLKRYPNKFLTVFLLFGSTVREEILTLVTILFSKFDFLINKSNKTIFLSLTKKLRWVGVVVEI